MHKLFLSCNKATELVEKNIDSNLPPKEWIQLKVHLLMCKACVAYEKQSLIIGNALKKYFHGNGNPKEDIIKNEELKERIISKL